MTVHPWRVYAFGISDVGRKRERNEDSYLTSLQLGLFIVADGMGGHAGGQVASRLTVDTVNEFTQEHLNHISDPTQLLGDALKQACHDVHDKSQREPALNGMGTTATALLIHRDNAFVGHVGDSRAYLIRNGHILQLSEDHSLVHEQMKAGLLTEEQARKSRYRNIITRSIGFERNVNVDTVSVTLQNGDTFLLCTDGLTTLIADQEICDLISCQALHQVPQMLVDLANHRGGDDNITVIVVHIAGVDLDPKQIRLFSNTDQATIFSPPTDP